MNLTSTDITSRRSRDVKLSDINFGPRLPLEQHPRYQGFRRLMGLRDFAAYREVFERGFAEISILCGEFVRLERLPITTDEPPNSLLVNLMGVNDHAPRRVRLLEEFLDQYECLGRQRFMREAAFNSAYVQDQMKTTQARTGNSGGRPGPIVQWQLGREIKHRVVTFLNVYENMKRFGTLVGTAHVVQETPSPLKPGDLPWAIDYCGYIKLRDGAHRRAAAHYLGWGTIPNLVFEFNRITVGDMVNRHPYLRDNFDWFCALVQRCREKGPFQRGEG